LLTRVVKLALVLDLLLLLRKTLFLLSLPLLRNKVVLHVPSTQVNVNVSAVEPSIEARDSSTLEDGAEALSATLPQLMTFMNLRLLIPLPL
nr:hypothetical protein [Tanacetum cinerariifolium]